jgi:hypothetical protein
MRQVTRAPAKMITSLLPPSRLRNAAVTKRQTTPRLWRGLPSALVPARNRETFKRPPSTPTTRAPPAVLTRPATHGSARTAPGSSIIAGSPTSSATFVPTCDTLVLSAGYVAVCQPPVRTSMALDRALLRRNTTGL